MQSTIHKHLWSILLIFYFIFHSCFALASFLFANPEVREEVHFFCLFNYLLLDPFEFLNTENRKEISLNSQVLSNITGCYDYSYFWNAIWFEII